MEFANQLIVETTSKRFTIPLPSPLSIWETREYCRKLCNGVAPYQLTLSGGVARASLFPVSYHSGA